MSTWSREFRQIANLLMSNPHPCALFWGEELTVMYNKAYAEGLFDATSISMSST